MQELPVDEDPLRPDDEDLIGSTEARRMCGGISSMTEWRWRHSETVGFPQPDFVIDGRNYWYKRTIRRFLARHANNKSQHCHGSSTGGYASGSQRARPLPSESSRNRTTPGHPPSKKETECLTESTSVPGERS